MIQSTESEFEKNTINRLQNLGYDYLSGGDVDRVSQKEVVLEDRLRKFLNKKYSELPEETVQEILVKVKSIHGASVDLRNKNFHEMLVAGMEIQYKKKDGKITNEFIYLVDWNEPE